MIIKRCLARNFGSCKEVDFDYSSLGLALVYGKTGAGKSTMIDVVQWALFGETAKGGLSNDVRPWGESEATFATIEVDDIKIYRVRGKPSENDLYWVENSDIKKRYRGKDTNETQELLNQKLGLDVDTFSATSYFHEFSDTANFFVAKAKDRRTLFNKLADLSLAELLSDATTVKKKEVKSEILKKENELARIDGKIEQLTATKASALARVDSWASEQTNSIARVEAAIEDFEKNKENEIALIKEQQEFEASCLKDLNQRLDKLKEATLPCPTCGIVDQHKDAQLAQLTRDIYRTQRLQERAEAESNFVAKRLNPHHARLAEVKSQANPYTAILEDACQALGKAHSQRILIKCALTALNVDLSAYTKLYDLSHRLRAELLKTAVKALERHTNDTLTQYFDAELTVTFTLETNDSIEITIQKNGNYCNYKQLSRGQRAILRLAFVLAVQNAATETQGIAGNIRFFDEVLDGMDTGLKLKAFTVFQALSNKVPNIVLIDHCEEFQNLFDTRYKVELKDNVSHITAE